MGGAVCHSTVSLVSRSSGIRRRTVLMAIWSSVRQRGTVAEVNASAEVEVPVLASAEVERVGVGEPRRVAVRCAQQQEHALALADPIVADVKVLRGRDPAHLHRAVVPQQLLDRGADQGRLSLQAPALIGVAQQRQQAIADHVGGRLVTIHQQEHSVGQ
jgi:hypothetical protein